jgi:integrase
VTSRQTPVLDPAEARALLDSIDTWTVVGLRDRALIGLMVYSFARIGAALGMAVEDIYTQNRRLWVRQRERGGKRHAMPCHHNLEEYLTGYLDGAGLGDDPKGAAVPRDRALHRPASAAPCCRRQMPMR